MADVTTVPFSGSSAETIEKAKAFWKCIDPPPEQKSTLAVSGINHRLKTAPQAGDGSLPLVKYLVLRSIANWRPCRFLEAWEINACNRDDGIHLPSEYLTKVLKDKLNKLIIMSLGLATYLEDAQKRKEQEQADYVQKITSFREEAQQTLAKRKVERLKKEAISHRQPKEYVFNISESSEEDDEAVEAMAEIDKFEDSLKQKEIIKPE
ncbi:unnamed protein product [Pocillopora meandrina]|uniref:Cilia- and flagella-associated protein HOATZ n=1 Tax=Pocillopora meandrina TaxID=46732 RepID=A0AAU9Y6L2_9CNID|nr:unnamed protein product [Pocillopora meandrina]